MSIDVELILPARGPVRDIPLATDRPCRNPQWRDESTYQDASAIMATRIRRLAATRPVLPQPGVERMIEHGSSPRRSGDDNR